MSAHEHLSPDEFGHESPVEHFGIKAVYAGDEKHLRKTHRSEHVGQQVRVPTSQLRGGQHRVDTARVHDIASSGLNDPREAESAKVQVTGLPNGQYMLNDGHHRVAADVLRGEQFHDVFVGSTYTTPYDSIDAWGT